MIAWNPAYFRSIQNKEQKSVGGNSMRISKIFGLTGLSIGRSKWADFLEPCA
jgi:hypothetical protein